MLGAASPFVLERRFVIVLRHWALTILHLALAFGIAVTLYGLILLAITETYRPGGHLAPVVYGFGLALAALVAISAGTLVSPSRFAKVTFFATSGLAVLLPAALYAQMVRAANGAQATCGTSSAASRAALRRCGCCHGCVPYRGCPASEQTTREHVVPRERRRRGDIFPVLRRRPTISESAPSP